MSLAEGALSGFFYQASLNIWSWSHPGCLELLPRLCATQTVKLLISSGQAGEGVPGGLRVSRSPTRSAQKEHLGQWPISEPHESHSKPSANQPDTLRKCPPGACKDGDPVPALSHCPEMFQAKYTRPLLPMNTH